MEIGIVKPVGIVNEMNDAYLAYSMSVIVSRALPDVRDGLKPVHRRVLYAMDQMGLQANRSFRKCAGIVGEVLKEYHPHGDAAVYDTLVRMAQPWNLRYPLVLGQGNFGCFTGDTAIRLLDGTEKTFAELAQLPADEVFFVYSVNAEGKIVAGEGRNARITRHNAELVAVELDNGAKIRCTPDHRFMLRDGSYKQAQDLTPDDSLMPGYFDTTKVRERTNEYLRVMQPATAGRYYNHRIVAVRPLAERADVYDITVADHHNFLIASGVFVHNSIDDDPAAAMRYTEAKMSAIAAELLADIDRDTVDFAPNYDGHSQEPTVLPARLPNLLLNGAAGIAVGMATNIPPHNLRELCDGITYLIDHPDATVEDLMRIILGPDFPTGGIIQGREGIRNMYANGRGRIVVRARTHIEENERGRMSIVVTELPYQVNKAELVKKIAELARDRKIDGISEVRDESDRQGMRVVIDLKRDANPDSVLNSLFKYTAMQSAFNANMLALVDRQPRTLTLKSFLQHYINHREIVLTRRTRYELRKAEERKHILDGLKIALDNLDAVINTIRQSRRDTAGLAEELQQQFGFSEAQAKAVLDLRLARLAALERQKIEDELKDVLQHIDYYHLLLSDINEIRKLIKQDLIELKEKYGDARRTEIQASEVGEFRAEDLIPNEEVVVTLTEKGYIKRLPSSTYRAQRRGGRGVTGMATRDDDTVRHLVVAHTHDSLLFFTDRGRVFQLRVHELPEVSRTAKGEHIINLISIEQSERVTAVVYVPKGVNRDFMIVATRKGEVKKTAMEEFEVVRRSGLIAMNLEPDDELIGARLAHADDDVLLVTAYGQAIRFSVEELRSASRTSGGVRGIRLAEGDTVVSLSIASPGSELLVVTVFGEVKRTPIDEYPRHSRGGSGVLTARVTDKTGKVAAARVITDHDNDLMIISAGGIVIRQDVNDIKRASRATQGVTLMHVADGDTVVAVATTNGKKLEQPEMNGANDPNDG